MCQFSIWGFFFVVWSMCVDGGIIQLSDENFEDVIDGEPILVNFFTEWSHHARKFKSVFVQVEEELRGEMKVGEFNLGKYTELYRRLSFIETYDVKTHPTVHLFDEGKWYRFPVDRERTVEEVLDFARKGFINAKAHDIKHVDRKNVTDTYAEYEDTLLIHPETGENLPDGEVRVFNDVDYDLDIQDGLGPFTWLLMLETNQCEKCDALVSVLQKSQRVLRSVTKQQVGRVNVDDNPEIKARFVVAKYPSLVMVHDKKYYVLGQSENIRVRDVVGFAQGGFLITDEGLYIEHTLQILDMDGNVIEERGPKIDTIDAKDNDKDVEVTRTKVRDGQRFEEVKTTKKSSILAEAKEDDARKKDNYNDDELEVFDDDGNNEHLEQHKQHFEHGESENTDIEPKTKSTRTRKEDRVRKVRKEDQKTFIKNDDVEDEEVPMEIVLFAQEQWELFLGEMTILADDVQDVWETKPFVLIFTTVFGVSAGLMFSTIVFFMLTSNKQ